MIIKEDLFTITDTKGNISYGGNQDWYSSNTRAQGGCSSVAGANALRLLCQCNPACRGIIRSSKKMPCEIKSALLDRKCFKDDFLMLMTGMYNTMRSFEVFPINLLYDRKERDHKAFKYIKANNGRSSIGYISGVLRYAAKLGLMLEYKALPTAFVGKECAAAFITEGLKSSGSVTILTSYNKHPLTTYNPTANTAMKCHFATITGMDDENIIISTWGKKATVNIDEWLKSLHSIKAWESTLFYFVPTDKISMIKSILASPLPFIKGIIQAIIRKAQ